MNKYIKLMDNGAVNWKELQSSLDELNEELEPLFSDKIKAVIELTYTYVCIIDTSQYEYSRLTISSFVYKFGGFLDFGYLRDEIYAVLLHNLEDELDSYNSRIDAIGSTMTKVKILRKKYGIRMES